MQWSILKSKFEALFAESLRGRLRVHLTEYTKASMDVGRGWFSLDGEEVVSVDVPSFYTNKITFRAETLNFGEAIGEYLQMTVAEAQHSADELIQAFVFLDRRFGKRSLEKVKAAQLHEFSRRLYELRCRAEESTTRSTTLVVGSENNGEDV